MRILLFISVLLGLLSFGNILKASSSIVKTDDACVPGQSDICNILVDTIYTYLYEHICEGDTFYFNGNPLTEPGEYTSTFITSNGADSVIILLLNVSTPLWAILFGEICPGDTAWLDTFAFIPGIYYDTIIGGGCGTHITGMLGELPFDTSVLVLGNTLEAQQPAFFIQWYDCETNLPIEGALGKSYTPEKGGYYKAWIITLDTCEGFTGCYYVSGVGTEEILPSVDWHIQPNPANDFLEIEFDQPIRQEIDIEIMDNFGRLQIKQTALFENNSERIDIRNLPPGVFLIKLIDEDGHFYTKLFSKV